MATEIVQTMLDTRAALDELNIPVALMGGLAVSAWKHFRATRDIDLLIAADVVAPDDLLRFLQARGYRPKRVPALHDFDGERVMQLVVPPRGKEYEFAVDLFLAESEYHRGALARRTSFRLPDGTELPVLTCEDVILFKARAARPVDIIEKPCPNPTRPSSAWKFTSSS